MPNSKILLPWFIATDDELYGMNILVCGNGCEYSRIKINKMESRDSFAGFFFVYEKNRFCVFLDKADKKAIIAINNNLHRVNDDACFSMRRSFFKRTLSFAQNGDSFAFHYEKFIHKFLANPFVAMMDVFWPDDWWEIVFDLPGWVYDRWCNDDLYNGIQRCLDHAVCNLIEGDRSCNLPE